MHISADDFLPGDADLSLKYPSASESYLHLFNETEYIVAASIYSAMSDLYDANDVSKVVIVVLYVVLMVLAYSCMF